MILNLYLTLRTKINSKWIINVNVNAKAIKPPEKKKKIFMTLGYAKMRKTQKTEARKDKIDKFDFIE